MQAKDSSKIHPQARIDKTVFVDDSATIGKAVIKGYSHIDAFAIIENNVNIRDSMIGANANIGKNSNIEGTTIGDNVEIGSNTKMQYGCLIETYSVIIESNSSFGLSVFVGTNTRIGTNVIIGDMAIIKRDVNIMANCVVESNAVVIRAPTSSYLYSNSEPFYRIDRNE